MKRLTATIILVAYGALLVKVMVFKDLPLIRIGSLMIRFGGTQDGPPNFLPFKTILPYLLGEAGLMIGFINIVGNIVLLVPIGFLFPFVYRNMTWKKSLALAIAAGSAIEGMQAVLHVGIFDIDDVILNGLGVMVGYWVYIIPGKTVHAMKYRKLIMIAGILFVVAAAAAFYGIAAIHKGPQRGDFRRDTANSGLERVDDGSGKVLQNADPCNGTGGTGQIVSMGNTTVTIKRNDGINEMINLTDHTTIKNSSGPLSKSDLKTGDRVTVVVESNHTATMVLVCNAGGPEL